VWLLNQSAEKVRPDLLFSYRKSQYCLPYVFGWLLAISNVHSQPEFSNSASKYGGCM